MHIHIKFNKNLAYLNAIITNKKNNNTHYAHITRLLKQKNKNTNIKPKRMYIANTHMHKHTQAIRHTKTKQAHKSQYKHTYIYTTHSAQQYVIPVCPSCHTRGSSSRELLGGRIVHSDFRCIIRSKHHQRAYS